MKLIILISIILIINCGFVKCFNNNNNNIIIEQIPILNLKNNQNFNKILNSNSILNEIDFNVYLQKVDHFNLLDDRRFYQRFVVNDNYWNGTGPVFFIIGGESQLDLGSVQYYQSAIWAKEVNALLVSLEHRFFGESLPLPDLSIDNLRYLTTQQALADCVTFMNWFSVYYNIPKTSKIVAFGGSYAGVLSTYLVTKYPTTFNFAISSSAPLDPVLNFYQYFQVIQTSILSFEGGEKCLENLKNSIGQVEEILLDKSNSSSNWIKETFNLCEQLVSDNDKSYFMDVLAITWSGAAQNLDIFANPKDVKSYCSIMNNENKNPLSNFVDVWYVDHLRRENNICYNSKYTSYVSAYSNITSDPKSWARQWIFLLCTEFGYFTTTDGDDQPFGNLITFDYKSQLCSDVFGIDKMEPSINWSLLQYGGLYPNPESVQNVLFVTGTNDPWSSIAISPTTVPDVNYNTVVVKNGAHCSDMVPINSVSVPDLSRAQNEIFQFILNNLNK